MNSSMNVRVVLFFVSIFSTVVHSSVPIKYTIPSSIQFDEGPIRSDSDSDNEALSPTSIQAITTIVQVKAQQKTIEEQKYDQLPYPALILEVVNSLIRTKAPAIPNKCDGENFEFPAISDKISIYYVCQDGINLRTSTYAKCENELQLTEEISNEDDFQIDLTRHQTCKKAGGNRYLIGYKGKNTPMYTIYETCYLDGGKAVFTKHNLSQINELYCRDCYPPKVLRSFAKEMKNFENELLETLLPKYLMEENNKLRQEGKHHLIPFQLVPHEEMLLYTWKNASKNKMNYSLIWSNVFENSLTKVYKLLRELMISSVYDVTIYTGVYEDENREYPLYIWKIIRDTKLKRSFTIVIHNQPPNDSYTYEYLCHRTSCERFGYHLEENNVSKGIMYCCRTTAFCDNIPFLKDKFKNFTPLVLSDLQSKRNLKNPIYKKCEILPDDWLHKNDNDHNDNADDPSNISNTSKPNDTPSFQEKLHSVEEKILQHYGNDIKLGNDSGSQEKRR